MIVHYTSNPRQDAVVMLEQFEFLIAHFRTQRDGIHCRVDCLECARYRELCITLLWPFRPQPAAFLHGLKARHA